MAKGPGAAYRARKKLGDVWRWCKGHGPHRWQLALHWIQRHIDAARKADPSTRRAHSLERWTSAKPIYAARLATARRHHQVTGHAPHFQPYMLNGHSDRITRAVENDIAVAVVVYDLACTSTSDGYPGDGRHTSTSLHYWQNNPDGSGLGRASDCAGARMVEYQHDRAKDPSRYLELFGPDNNGWVKNGATFNEPEGTALENLHDSHVHAAPHG